MTHQQQSPIQGQGDLVTILAIAAIVVESGQKPKQFSVQKVQSSANK